MKYTGSDQPCGVVGFSVYVKLLFRVEYWITQSQILRHTFVETFRTRKSFEKYVKLIKWRQKSGWTSTFKLYLVNKSAAISILCAAHSVMSCLRKRGHIIYMYSGTIIGVGAGRNDLIQSRICSSLLSEVVHIDGR